MADYNPHDVIIAVAGKDASEGFNYILRAPALPRNLDPHIAAAVASGYYRMAISGAQAAATKARKESKPEREAVQAYLDSFKPPVIASATIGAFQRSVLREQLKARGASTSDENVELNLEKFLAGRGAELVEAELTKLLSEPYEVTKRGSGGTGASAKTGTLDW